MIGSEAAWARVRDRGAGKGVVVAVIDTGVACEEDAKCYQARDFKGTTFTRGYDFVNDDEHPNDDHGHGTHVAGTIAETTNNGEGVAGLAFDATVMPIKVLDRWGSGSSADIADAIRFAADKGAKVINMSLGGPFPDRVMETACQYAAKKGVVIVCAAGNSRGGPVGYPAAFAPCIAVSSVGPTGDLAPYSSIGKQVAIAAPGGDKTKGDQFGILQNTVLFDTGNREDDYFAFQGTSMASPHVAAVAALAIARGVQDRDQVKSLLQRAATPKKPQTRFGAGILHAARTVELADAALRDSWLKLAFTLLAAVTGLGVGAVRSQAKGLLGFPSLTFGLLLGLVGPDVAAWWMGGSASPFMLLFHSALIPLYLLWEANSRSLYRFVGAMAAGSALHLGFDAFSGAAMFGGAGVVPAHGVPWLWVNAAVGLGVALVAYRRSFLTK
ncbi:MAG: peptidase S8 [Armatimonadetes bacterium]|nr:peptidase S8 [Armatimonadota bacterium]